MTDRITVALALEALLTAHETEGEDLAELIELMRERHNELVDVLIDAPHKPTDGP